MTSRRLFLIGRDADSCALLTEILVDDHPDARAWRFRCVVDAGAALLRCRASAIPDALILVDGRDSWVETCLGECIAARRELSAVPVFALAAEHSWPEPSEQARRQGMDLRPVPVRFDRDGLAAACRAILDACGPANAAPSQPLPLLPVPTPHPISPEEAPERRIA
ncbi:hypothetical protein [Thetidibacter halocola]|uniref:Uncharacterized protein n=1 Tax=Thetidibacter halocola TaxID=2827239 RepID=A0A8J7WA29_9RHOB|nr:hypothetical protein [Thetidibacter halocola]MBS0123695.1 hypothetical protein [Thetidibacter halocola]